MNACNATPALMLKAMMFGSASVPMVFWFAPLEKPSERVMPYWFGSALSPSAVVPILLPTTMTLVLDPEIC